MRMKLQNGICFLFSAGGLTSKWFALESSLLTIFSSISALLFVRDRTSKNARRMFYGSLLYLPIFMSGLLLHRQPNEQHEHVISEVEVHEGNSSSTGQYKQRKDPTCTQARPPVAYASVAPFPFLPVPLYVSPDS